MAQTKRTVPRECVACGAAQPKVYGIPDPCLGMLPGVNNACCGHGNAHQAYVQVLVDKRIPMAVYGDEARDLQIALGGQPAEFDRDTTPESAWSGWRAI